MIQGEVLVLITGIVYANMQAIAINGVWVLFNEDGMIFNKWYDSVKGSIPTVIKKPIFSCIRCMGSFWGGLTYIPVFFYCGVNFYTLFFLILDILCLVYLNFYWFKK